MQISLKNSDKKAQVAGSLADKISQLPWYLNKDGDVVCPYYDKELKLKVRYLKNVVYGSLDVRVTCRDGNPLNCLPENLTSTSGSTYIAIKDKWKGQFTYEGKVYFCGYFDTSEEASAASLKKKKDTKAMKSDPKT